MFFLKKCHSLKNILKLHFIYLLCVVWGVHECGHPRAAFGIHLVLSFYPVGLWDQTRVMESAFTSLAISPAPFFLPSWRFPYLFTLKYDHICHPLFLSNSLILHQHSFSQLLAFFFYDPVSPVCSAHWCEVHCSTEKLVRMKTDVTQKTLWVNFMHWNVHNNMSPIL